MMHIVETALREVFLWDDLKDQLKVKATTLQLEQQQKLCIASAAATETAGDFDG